MSVGLVLSEGGSVPGSPSFWRPLATFGGPRLVEASPHVSFHQMSYSLFPMYLCPKFPVL